MSLKQGYEQADTDGLCYRKEDCHWWVHPSEDDGVGVIGPKPGAVPVPRSEAGESSSATVCN